MRSGWNEPTAITTIQSDRRDTPFSVWPVAQLDQLNYAASRPDLEARWGACAHRAHGSNAKGVMSAMLGRQRMAVDRGDWLDGFRTARTLPTNRSGPSGPSHWHSLGALAFACAAGCGPLGHLDRLVASGLLCLQPVMTWLACTIDAPCWWSRSSTPQPTSPGSFFPCRTPGSIPACTPCSCTSAPSRFPPRCFKAQYVEIPSPASTPNSPASTNR